MLVPAGFAALVYLITTEDLAARLKQADWRLLAGIVVSQVSVFLCAVRLAYMVAAWGERIPLLSTYKIHLRSLFYFVFVPFSIGADVARIAMLSGLFPNENRAQTIGVVLSDRVVGFLTFLAISILAFIPTSRMMAESVGISRGYVVAVLAMLFVAAAGSLLSRMDHFRIRRKGEAFLAAFRSSIQWVGKALGTSILMQLCMCSAVFLAAHSFAIPIHWSHVVFVVSSAMLFQLIPVSVGGVGATEVVAVGLYMAVGLGRTDAVMLSSVAFTFKLLSALIGGLLEYVGTLRGGRRPAMENAHTRSH